MNVRRFTPSDTNDVINLWQTVFPDDPPHNEPAAMLKAKLAVDDLIFVAEQNDKLIGACMAGYDGHRGWLYAVAVLPQYRRAGTGEQLVECAINALKARGCVKINLQVRSTNQAVVAFYQALGFSVEERISMGRLL